MPADRRILRAMFGCMMVAPIVLALSATPVSAVPLPGEKPIQPGAPVCTVGGPLDDGACGEWSTLNFVFTDQDGTSYIGGSAHNFAAVGDRATIRGEPS